jgi:hypothetical protein
MGAEVDDVGGGVGLLARASNPSSALRKELARFQKGWAICGESDRLLRATAI